jgi:hypothetical protein
MANPKRTPGTFKPRADVLLQSGKGRRKVNQSRLCPLCCLAALMMKEQKSRGQAARI